MIVYHLYLVSLTFFSICLFAEQHVPTFFNPRSISRDAARDLVGTVNYINQDNNQKTASGLLSITPEWTQTFNHLIITQSLFGSNLICNPGQPHLKISGSTVSNRSKQDLLADYFYLPTDFESAVTFSPTIDNFIIDVGWYLALDGWKKGIYYWIHAPFAHTRWNLNIHEDIINPGTANYQPGYFTPDTINRNQLLNTFTEFANGKTIKNNGLTAFQELKSAEMSSTNLTKTRVAEIRTGFGWNFYTEENYHVGINAQVAFPTGLRPKGNYLFEPIVGNGHFWELGFGGNAHYTFWHNAEETKKWTIYGDINLTHLFTTRQKRTFDLKSAGPLSRYMLAMEMTQPAINLLGNGVLPNAQFDNQYLPVANITTCHVNVDIALQADAVMMFNYTSEKLSYDLGYNFWGRTKENIALHTIESFSENRFSLKGNAQIFGFEKNSSSPIALSATESQSTINTGTTNTTTNTGIDFPRLATTNPATPLIAVSLQSTPNSSGTDQINTSVQPTFLTYNDVDTQTAGSRASSSKVFAHISYSTQAKNGWQPYAGFGGSVEFNHKHSTNKNSCCSGSTGVSQWGLWIKTGTAFN